MENTAYNRNISEQVKQINNKYLMNLNTTGKQVLDDNLVPLVKPLVKYDESSKEGSGLLSGVLSTFGLGAPTGEGKRRRGRPKKNMKVGEGFLDDVVSSIGSSLLGGKKQRGRPKKNMKVGEGFFDDMMAGLSTGFSIPVQLATKVLGGKKKGGIIKTEFSAGKKANYGQESIPVKSGNGVNARAVGCGNAGMEGAGLLDDIGGLAKVALPLILAGKKGRPRKGGNVGVNAMAEQRNLLTGNGKKKGQSKPSKPSKVASGIFDDILSGIGSVVKTTADVAPDALKLFKMVKGKGKAKAEKKAEKKAGKKASSWVDHVKTYAKKNNISYKDALKKAGPSYKK